VTGRRGGRWAEPSGSSAATASGSTSGLRELVDA